MRGGGDTDRDGRGLCLLLGGARSGKSALAVRWGRAFDGPVAFIATALAGDDEMRRRIDRHRADRPPGWHTIEEPTDVVGALTRVDGGALVIVDCLTLWLANVLARVADDAVLAAADTLGAAAAVRTAPTVIVTNEVGTGIVPADAATRRYRDLLGGVNTAVAAHAAQALLVVAGRVLPLSAAPSLPTGLV